jgi:hypothetical protein
VAFAPPPPPPPPNPPPPQRKNVENGPNRTFAAVQKNVRFQLRRDNANWLLVTRAAT